MSQCVFVNGTRFCNGSPYYRVNGRARSKFHKMTDAMKKKRLPAQLAINALGIDPEQQKLATDLLDVVLSARWDPKKQGANAQYIVESVRLLLVDQVPDSGGWFTLVSY